MNEFSFKRRSDYTFQAPKSQKSGKLTNNHFTHQRIDDFAHNYYSNIKKRDHNFIRSPRRSTDEEMYSF
jgi:hypothetical protein